MESDRTLSFPIFPYRGKDYKRGNQKCVRYVGTDFNNPRFGGGHPLVAVIEFTIPITRYAPRLDEIAKLLAVWKAFYGEEIIKDLLERIEELEPAAEEEVRRLIRNAEILFPKTTCWNSRNGTAENGACHQDGLVV